MMKKRLLQYLIHIFATLLVLVTAAIVFGLMNGASVHYGDDPKATIISQDGPYVFFEGEDTLSVNYVSGSRVDGYYVSTRTIPEGASESVTAYNSYDSTSFDILLKTEFKQPRVIYDDGNKILAVSDIEGNYIAFRDFLITSGVVDKDLGWIFGNGHLVLVGDFVDRGMFVTQVLWLVYKLDQEAALHGGQVHFIVGNHELKAMQGNYLAASPKYYRVAAVLGKQQFALYNSVSVIGRWLASKNAIERINGVLFVHGGIHPDLADSDLSLEDLNQMMRDNYYTTYFPRPTRDIEQLVLSTETGPSWYRGYFKADLTQGQVERSLDKYGAKAAVVGHTIQRKVNRQFQGKVIGIDVLHPSDDHKSWPGRRSEGLLIEGDVYYRVLDDGKKKVLK